MRFCGIIGIVLCLAFSGYAQEFQMRHFGVNEGLAGSQVYDINQSPTGDIWIATDLGASQYDGYNFTTYTAEDGLADNSIVKLAIQDSGVVWMLGFNRKLSWIDDSAHPYSGNANLLEKLGPDQVTSLGFDQEKNLLLGAQSSSKRNGYLIRLQGDENLVSSPSSSGLSWDPQAQVFGGPFQDSLFQPFSDNPVIPLTTEGREMARKVLFDAQRNCWYILTRTELWQVGSNGQVKKLNLSGTTTGAMAQDGFGNLWIGSYHGLFITHPDQWGKLTRILEKNAVSALCSDSRNGIWIGTFSDGVYHLKNLYMVHYRTIGAIEDPDVKRINNGGDAIYFSDTRNLLYQLKYTDWISGSAQLYVQSESPINAIYSDRGKNHLLSNSVKKQGPFSSPISGLCIHPGKKASEYWVGKIYSFAYYEGDQETFNSAEIGFQERVNCLYYEAENDKLWLGTLSGLYIF